MIAVTKPKFFMPIHGEYRHLKAHAEIAESLNIKSSRILIADNGDVLELSAKSFKKIDTLDLSHIYVDGKEIGDIESNVIKDRHAMSTDGIIFIVIVISEGMLMREPDIFSRGFLGTKEEKVLELIRKDANERIKKLLADGNSANDISAHLKKGVKNYIFKLTRRNPLIVIEILEV